MISISKKELKQMKQIKQKQTRRNKNCQKKFNNTVDELIIKNEFQGY